MQKILVVEDDSTTLDLIQELVDMLENYEVELLNPNEVPLEEILQSIERNEYAFIMLDHNYSEVNYTGKAIADNCSYSGDIYSISGEDTKEVNYCTKYIGKRGIMKFFNNLKICA